MNSIRKWFYRPRREDPSKLVQFYYADEELNLIAAELDSFDGHKDPDRCSTLVNQLRLCQDKVLNICNEIMDEAIPESRADRDYCIKFPDEMLHENLAGQLWFGAECLAAGSNVANREEESKEIRPLAKAVTKALDDVRNLLRDHCLKNCQIYSEKLKDALEIFDKLFAEFELRYVAIMVPIKTLKECHLQQEIVVLFSETLQRALQIDLVTQDMIDDCDPSLMFAVPRLAIVCGLIIYTDGPLNLDNGYMEMSDLFKPFYSTLCEIRELLWTLSSTELSLLEKSLCSAGEFQAETSVDAIYPIHKYQNYVDLFLQNHQSCQQFIQDFYGCHVTVSQHDQDLLASGNITETWQTRELVSNHECLTSSSSFENTSNCASASLVDGNNSKALHCTDNTHLYIPNDCLSVDVTQSDSTENSAQSSEIANPLSSNVNICSKSDFDNFSNTRTSCTELGQNSECLTWSTEDTQKLYEANLKENSNKICQAAESATRETNCSNDCQEENITTTYDTTDYNQCSSERKITRITSTQSPDSCSDIARNNWKHRPTLDDMYDAVDSIDDEAIALALQTAEIASRNEARSNYKNSEELIHKLFVEISGVADQLQTNCASDLRNILKSVFNMNSLNSNVPDVSTSVKCSGTGSEENSSDEEVTEDTNNVTDDVPELSAISVLIPHEEQDGGSIDSAEEAIPESLFCETNEQQTLEFTGCSGEPPCWMPDEDADQCMSCYAHFTLLRRRHHCRNCGKIFCSRCSSYSISLPHYGHQKPVRVCHRCFIHQVTPYVVSQRCSTCPPL